MHHYVNSIEDTKGNALIGFFVRCVDATTGLSETLYADTSLTPILSVSGLANAAQVNSDGNVDFYIAAGSYHLDIYATDGTTFVRRIQNIPMIEDLLLPTAYAIGLFTNAASEVIGSSAGLIQTTGYSAADIGSAVYAYDAAVDAAYVTANPRTSFVSANGRGFRLSHEQDLTPEMFGADDNDDPDADSLAAFSSFITAYGNTYSRAVILPQMAASAVANPPYGFYSLFVDSADHALKLKDAFGSIGAISPTPTPSPIYPLDGAGTLPAFAYSTRKLTSTWTGSAIRVVRPSDSVTLDVGFVGQDLDIDALDTFLGTEIGHVDIWYDQSGNGHHATQTTDANRPLVENGSVEGGPVLFKDKRPLIFNEKYMAIPVGVTANRNAFNVFMAVEMELGPGELGALIQLGSGVTNQISTFQQLVDLNSQGLPSLSKPIEQRPALIELIGNGTTGTISQDFDSTTGTISGASMAGGFIGNTDFTTGYILSAYASAVIGYARVLSSPEGTVIRNAMRSLFNLVSTANSGRVIYVGDSITAGFGGTAYGYGYGKMTQRQLSNDIAFYNMGQGGTLLVNKLTTYATDGAGYVLTKYTDNRVVFMLFGTNDLTTGGRSAAQIYADIQTYAGNVRTDGGKIIVCTLTPNAAWNSTQQTTWNTLNASIRSGWASFADGLCDFALNPTMGPFAAAGDSTLYIDGLHPTRKGHAYLAPQALAALQALV